MKYPELVLARNLLANNGVIFISINDGEVAQLKKMCDEVYGEHNFIADLIWSNKEGGGSSDSKLFRIKHEHIICYAKSIEFVDIIGVPVGNEDRYSYKTSLFHPWQILFTEIGNGTISFQLA
jgi:adenine-specific DNA-methyltransferase